MLKPNAVQSLVIGYIGHVVGLIVMLLMQNAIALWMRQFNVPAWGQSNDPLPPFINDPRDGAAATYLNFFTSNLPNPFSITIVSFK